MDSKKIISSFIGFVFVSIIYYFICQYFPGLPGYHQFHFTPEKYNSELNRINSSRKKLNEEFNLSIDKKKTLQKTAHLFQDELDMNLFPYWFGTDYDFYGKTEIPGKGEIACGYFVTTLLEDMGLKIDREALAKMASEKMIQELVQAKHIKRYSNQPLGKVISDIEFNGKAVYIIGLDTHTGFIIHNGENIYFIHASGRHPWQVIEEEVIDSKVLNKSKYRVTGNLTKDTILLKKWLNN